MKRLTLTTAVLAILMAPAAFAQSTLNTTAPGASQETKPGQTNNNLQNPGSNHNQMAPQSTATQTQAPSTTPDSTTGTMNNDTTGTSTGTMNNTDSTTTTTTAPTTGTMNNTDSTTSTGAYNGGTSTTTTSTSSRRLPKTASDLPTVMVAGLLALFAAFALRFYSKRNA